MSLKNTSTSYGSISKFLHWTIAILVLGMLIFGFFLDDFSKDSAPFYYNLHKVTGVTILLLMFFRLFWTSINIKPVLPVNNMFEKLLEHTVQYSLYVFLFAMPLLGWVGASSGGRPPHIGDWQLALPIPADTALVKTCFYMHNKIAWFLIVVISLHVLAALYHYFIRKDDVLLRMMPQHQN